MTSVVGQYGPPAFTAMLGALATPLPA
jgi:hypothetical protein